MDPPSYRNVRMHLKRCFFLAEAMKNLHPSHAATNHCVVFVVLQLTLRKISAPTATSQGAIETVFVAGNVTDKPLSVDWSVD